MGNGYDFLREAERYIGQREDANRPNRSGGPIVDACQIAAGYEPGVPWCGCYTVKCAKDAGYQSYIDICHGYTGYIYDRAQQRGWVRDGGADVPPGSLFIINGKHVGIVRSSGKDYFTTLEGNASDACRSLTRAWADGWKAIVPPDLGTTGNGTREVYGFEDLEVKPKRYGGWATQAVRDQQMKKFQQQNPEKWVRPIRIATKSPFAFEAGNAGTYGKAWNYGPWADKATRDSQMAGWKRLNHDNVRTYRKTIKGSSGPTGGSTNGIGDVE